MKIVRLIKGFSGNRYLIFFIYFLLNGHLAIAANNTEGASAFYESALKHYNNRQYDKTVIELKNALQENPRLLPALVLLGKTYLETGNPSAAEAAIKDAIELGADLSLVIIPLNNAYLKQFKHDFLLAKNVPDALPAGIKSELYLLRARAAFEINNRSVLDDSIAEAERLSPIAPDLLALKAAISMRSAEFDKTQQIISQLKKLYPESPNTWLTDASLKHVQGNLAEALASYEKVIHLSPDNHDARIARIALLIDLNRHKEIDIGIKALAKAMPSDPRIRYLRAVTLAHAGKHQESISDLNETLNLLDALGNKVVMQNQQLLMIAAVTNYSLNKLESARNYLEIYVNSSTHELAPQRILASIYMRQGEFYNAIDLLKKMAEASPNNPNILAMLAQAYDSAGKHQQSIVTIEEALKHKGYDPKLKTQLAISKINAGQMEQGLGDLNALYNLDQTQPAISLSLAVSLLIHGKFESAVDISRTLVKNSPSDLANQNLLAIALVGIGNYAEAKKLFGNILISLPDNPSVKMNLAKLELREGHIEKAQLLLRELITRNGNSPEIMLEMSRVSASQGDKIGALRWARDAVSAAPKSFSTNSHLIDLLLETGDTQQALKVALDQETIHPNNLYVLEAQVKALQAAQNKSQLLSLLRRMSTLAEFNTRWLLKIAYYQIKAESLQEASYTLFRGLQGNPEHFATRALLADVEVRLGRLEQALERAKQLIIDHPNAQEGYILVGDVRMERGQFNDAIASYSEALKYNNTSLAVLRLYIAQRYANQDKQAKTTLLEWLTNHPKDLQVKNALAEFYLSTSNYTEATRIYQELIKTQGETAYLNNNIAYCLFQLNQTQDAVNYARRAYQLSPTDPMINDTLGWLLVHNNNPAEGLPFLREALTRVPIDMEIRYHLAAALFKLNRHSEARRELMIALEPKINFNGYDAAVHLLEALNNEL